ncbi:MAG: acyl-CoA dehydrogenase [Alphaproteobacteria bacterium]|nr:acyl-CoA dehydrogenase [Alphaproteobacteria bacterium]
MSYAPPIQDMRFALEVVAEFDRLRAVAGADGLDRDTIGQILEEAGKLAGDVIAPLNAGGDRHGARLDNGVVRTAPGWREAYRAFVDGGWNTLPFEPEHGGQGLPWGVATAVHEMWESASLAFALCPLLTAGAIDLLQAHASPAQKATYLPKMVSGVWTGTMNLTEPQAGSDVGALRTRAVRDGDRYRITGQKIFITYGDHDMTENVIHMVLARTPDAPPGSRGISLFIVPKFLVKPDGSPGERNDLRVVSLEHKLGIHASPTCVMAYGDGDGAIGFLVGEENRGLEYMFTMMNSARLAVGLQGVAIAERAYQQARRFAQGRVQSRELGARSAAPVPIVRHPDVRRMLLAMRTAAEAARAVAYLAAVELDLARRHPDPAARTRHQLRVDLLIPVVKAWSTDLGVEVASIGVQVHGGMGFIEETGAAQHYRDARILPIYEGTNGIQANDLVFRKLARDDGAAAATLLAEIAAIAGAAAESAEPALRIAGARLADGERALADATATLLRRHGEGPRLVAVGAAAYLRLFGLVAGGFAMTKSALAASRALAAGDGDARFLRAKLVSARFYADHWLSQAPGLRHAATAADDDVLALADDEV